MLELGYVAALEITKRRVWLPKNIMTQYMKLTMNTIVDSSQHQPLYLNDASVA